MTFLFWALLSSEYSCFFFVRVEKERRQREREGIKTFAKRHPERGTKTHFSKNRPASLLYMFLSLVAAARPRPLSASLGAQRVVFIRDACHEKALFLPREAAERRRRAVFELLFLLQGARRRACFLSPLPPSLLSLLSCLRLSQKSNNVSSPSGTSLERSSQQFCRPFCVCVSFGGVGDGDFRGRGKRQGKIRQRKEECDSCLQ